MRVSRVDLRQAERLADAATWLAEKLDDDRCRAHSLRAMGYVLLIRREYTQALRQFEAALRLFRRLREDVDVGRTLSNVLHTLNFLGRYDDALESAKEARRIFERHNEPLRLARLDAAISNVLTAESIRGRAAAYERAREPLMQVGEPRTCVLMNMAICTCAW
jgi:tetratricopeptide (TPR) repeat protein